MTLLCRLFFYNFTTRSNIVKLSIPAMSSNKYFSSKKNIDPKFTDLFIGDQMNYSEAATKSAEIKNRITKSHKRKQMYTLKLNDHIKNDTKSEFINNLINDKKINEALIFVQNADHLNAFNISIKSLRIMCSVAAQEGKIDMVKKLQNIAQSLHNRFYKDNLELNHYLAQAEFHAGLHLKAFVSLAEIYQLDLPKNLHLDENLFENIVSSHKDSKCKIITKKQWKIICHKKLKDSICILIKQVPAVNNPVLWSQMECLVRLLIFHYNIIPPGFTLWITFLASPYSNHLEMADNLLEKEVRIRHYIPCKLHHIVTVLLRINNKELVLHFIQQLLKYDLKQLLSPVVSLLISMQTVEGNSSAVLETLKFSYSLQIPLTANALVRAQQTLYEARLPLPMEMMGRKYPGFKDYTPSNPPPFQF